MFVNCGNDELNEYNYIFDHFYEFWKLKKETMDKSEASSIVEIEKKYRIQYKQKTADAF